jgi:hypothetical protein
LTSDGQTSGRAPPTMAKGNPTTPPPATARSTPGLGRLFAAVTTRRDPTVRVLDEAPTTAVPRRRRVRRLVGRVPAPLAALFAAVIVFGVSWALIDPAWQAPDEDVHFSYVQTLGELHRLPGSRPGPSLSAAQVYAMQSLNNDAVVFFPYARPEWSKERFQFYKRLAGKVPGNTAGGPNTASGYPPAYYLSVTPGYLLTKHSNAVTQLYAVRLVSMLWLLVTTTGVWLLAGELFGRRRHLQLAAAATVGLWPMVDFISASVNPDSLLYALSALTLWLGVRIIRRGLTPGMAAGFGACVGLALITKATALALVPAFGFVLALGVWRLLRVCDRRRALLAGALGVGLVLVLVGVWHEIVASQHRAAYGQVAGVTSGVTNWREFGSYVWQYYLPKLWFQTPVHFDLPVVSHYPAYNVWVAMSWAAFGWVSIWFPFGIYHVFLAITVLVGLAALARVIVQARRRAGSPSLRREWLPIGVFFGSAIVVLLAGLHWAEYHSRHALNQGRYLFPLAGLAGCALALALSWLPRRWQPPAVGVVCALLVVFQLFCLALVGSHYYAV